MKKMTFYLAFALLYLVTSFLVFLSCENEQSTNPNDKEPSIYGSVILDGSQTHDGVLVRIIQTGDSIFVVGFEYFQPPLLNCIDETSNHDFDLILISSLGDKEKMPICQNLGSVTEVWRYGYIIESAESTIPQPYNGVIEIEPTGGRVIAMYHSYWLNRYICKSIDVISGRI